ncbi:MAG: monofunctional biosynthetic peptidoglycan transglycosylase [Dongiaceae bacterium]
METDPLTLEPRPAPTEPARPRRSLLRRLFRWIFRAAASFAILSVALVMLYGIVPPPITVFMINSVLAGEGLDRRWRSIDAMSPDLVRAAIAAEDARFCLHGGFDWASIRKAWDRMQSGGRQLRGGSTISMQTAKNVFLWPARSWTRKGFEAYFTVLIELFWTKRRIMEVYLNVAEFGPGVFGAESASQDFFGKPASELTRREAALLAAVLPNPREWSAAKPGPYVRERAGMLQRRLLDVPEAGAAVCPAKPAAGG